MIKRKPVSKIETIRIHTRKTAKLTKILLMDGKDTPEVIGVVEAEEVPANHVTDRSNVDNGNVRSVKYDTRSIPNDWMSDSETISKLNTFITELEESVINQLNLDNKYEDFVKIVHTEMDLKLVKRKTNIYDGKSNKRRRMKKSWWNDNLTLLWNDVCKAERAWHKCHNGCKKDLRHIFVEKRKLFDKSSQKAKRQFWYHSQEQLLDDQKRDPREFWKKIGKVGVGNERQKSIPMEVTLDDGTTSTDTNTLNESLMDKISGEVGVAREISATHDDV
ncbi:unnamed protein product [Mytilus edulis]|uniref:Uncharacterized protein n=1 Tax=Mytilus edulis TaxID=6550 RepID=A0A8S3V5R6_MYTED|nr:unnamed protein product [Mytilus edulis]